MEIFMISGKSGSGKDTLATLMRKKLENVGCNCITLHYADLVKSYAIQYYNWNGIKDEAGRTLLQQLGTNKVRAKYPDYWAEAIGKFLAAIPKDFDCAFIPDARFPNEIEVVKYYNPFARTIRVERFNEDRTPYINPVFTSIQLNHPSETSLDNYNNFDYIVENRGNDLSMLQNAADIILADTRLLI